MIKLLSGVRVRSSGEVFREEQPVALATPHEAVDHGINAVHQEVVLCPHLSKNAEERYQTASGLEADLRRGLTDMEKLGKIDPFPLAAHDVSGRLMIPERLYGREAQMKTLLATFDRVLARGRTELVLVSGYSGVGKSSFVNQLRKELAPSTGLFTGGKFDQFRRDIPYATVAQGFQSLIRQLLAKKEEKLIRWQDALRNALGPDGQLMVGLIRARAPDRQAGTHPGSSAAGRAEPLPNGVSPISCRLHPASTPPRPVPRRSAVAGCSNARFDQTSGNRT